MPEHVTDIGIKISQTGRIDKTELEIAPDDFVAELFDIFSFVIDLGVDVTKEKFLVALKENPGAYVGMSALLTTTMINMEESVKAIKEADPAAKVFVGGAPLSKEFNDKIGADGYFPDPHTFVKSLSA